MTSPADGPKRTAISTVSNAKAYLTQDCVGFLRRILLRGHQKVMLIPDMHCMGHTSPFALFLLQQKKGASSSPVYP